VLKQATGNFHGQLWGHKTHHGPNSREATTFPHMVFFVPLRESHIQMAFLSRDSQKEVLKLLKLDSRNFARP
jgi:hypothetical protein